MPDLSFNFATVETPTGLADLNKHLERFSFVAGEKAPSTDDLAVFKKLGKEAKLDGFVHVARWYKHVATWADKPPAGLAKGEFPLVEEKEDEVDLFGDDEEEEDDALKKKTEALKAAKGKKREAAKSSLVIHIEPANVDTDLDEVLRLVKAIKLEGVTWGAASTRIPLGYGIEKLQVSCTILDDLVNTNELTDTIEELGLTEAEKEERRKKLEEGSDDEGDSDDEESPGLVQTANIVSFNKL